MTLMIEFVEFFTGRRGELVVTPAKIQNFSKLQILNMANLMEKTYYSDVQNRNITVSLFVFFTCSLISNQAKSLQKKQLRKFE